MRCAKCEKELHACRCYGDEWCSLAGTKREWGEGMVEKLVAITKDDTVCIICHESVKDMVELKRAWVGLTDDEVFTLWMRSPAETENRFAFAKAIEAKLREKNA